MECDSIFDNLIYGSRRSSTLWWSGESLSPECSAETMLFGHVLTHTREVQPLEVVLLEWYNNPHLSKPSTCR
jgi:hypothetical protein